MAFCYRRTFIDELPPAPCTKPRAQSTPPARAVPADEETVSLDVDVRNLSRRAEELPKLQKLQKLCRVGASGSSESLESTESTAAGDSEGESSPQSGEEMQLDLSRTPQVERAEAAKGRGVAELGEPVSPESQVEDDGQDGLAETAGELPNPGSYGHPEACRKPCLFFQQGQCENGSACGYCHLPHVKRPILPDRKQRSLLRKLKSTDMLATFVPHLKTRAVQAGIEEEAKEVIRIMEQALQQSNPRRTKLVGDDADILHLLLSRMTFGSLMAMLLHNLSACPWVETARRAQEDLRQAIAI